MLLLELELLEELDWVHLPCQEHLVVVGMVVMAMMAAMAVLMQKK